METFLYNVSEIDRNSHSIEEVMDFFNKLEEEKGEDQEHDDEEEEYYIDIDEESLIKEYTSYRVYELEDILKYYSIPRKKMKKADIVKTIVAFELNQENAALVQLRYSDS